MDKPEKLEIWDEAKLKLQFPGRIIVNTEGEHYKFWSAQPDNDGHYIAYWGRIGKKIQSTKVWGDEWEISQKIKQKIKKGYREI